MTNFSKTSAQGWEAAPKVDQGTDTRPDTIPPVSGRTSPGDTFTGESGHPLPKVESVA